MPKDIRVYESDEIEIRAGAGEESEERFVEGIGIVYDREVEIFPGFREKIRAGAFDRSLRSQSEIKSFFNHRPDYILSTTRSRPALVLADSEKGLRFRSPIPPTTYGNDLRVNLDRKNIRGASFAFSVEREGQIITRDEKGVLHREITKATLYEIGPVTNPAYAKTTASLRSAEDTYKECLEIVEREERSGQEQEIEKNREKIKLMNQIVDSL